MRGAGDTKMSKRVHALGMDSRVGETGGYFSSLFSAACCRMEKAVNERRTQSIHKSWKEKVSD